MRWVIVVVVVVVVGQKSNAFDGWQKKWGEHLKLGDCWVEISTFSKCPHPILQLSIAYTRLTMRRALPRTISRAVQAVSSRPLPVPIAARRFASSDPSSSSSSSSTSLPAESRIPLIITQPASSHPSSQSAIRTRAHKINQRKETRPDHPKFSDNVFNDERLFDIESSTQVRMPHANELDFDALREKGFFPGDVKVSRTHYLDFLAAWRSRVRGEVGLVWQRDVQDWVESSRTAFLFRYCKERGLPIDHTAPRASRISPLTLDEFFMANKVGLLDLQVEDLSPEACEKYLGFDPRLEGVSIRFEDADKIIFSMSGSEDEMAVDLDALQEHVKEVINWAAVEARMAGKSEEDRPDLSPVKFENVGYQVFLPNIVIRLIRNDTKPGQAYDPWTATFRIPPSMTKTDLRSYLKAVYNLDVTFIRTSLRWGKVVRDQNGRKVRQKGSQHNYKRAVVGLHQPFHYPDDEEELRALGRATGLGDKLYDARMKTVNETFFIKENAEYRKKAITRVYKRASERFRSAGENSRVSRVLSSCINMNADHIAGGRSTIDGEEEAERSCD